MRAQNFLSYHLIQIPWSAASSVHLTLIKAVQFFPLVERYLLGQGGTYVHMKIVVVDVFVVVGNEAC